MKLTSKQAI